MRRILLLALVLRLLPIFWTDAREIVPDWRGLPMDRDGIGYASYAEHLWKGEGYREDSGERSHRAPGYPFLLYVGFLLGGHQFLAARVLQALLGTLSCWILGRTAASAWGERAGFWAAIVAAVYPPFVFYSAQILNSTLYMTLVVATLAAVWKGRAFLGGVLLGASALVAGTVLGAAPALALWLLWRGRSWRAPALLALGTALVLAPWTWRNWQVHRSLILLDTNSGGVMYLGNVNYGRWVDPEAPDALDSVRRKTAYLTLDEAGKDRLLRNLTKLWIRENPLEFARVWTLKFLHGWSPVPDRKSWPVVLASLATYGVVLLFGAASALGRLGGRDPLALLLCGFLLAVSAAHAVFVIAHRHRVPLFDPCLILLAAPVLARVFPGPLAPGRGSGV